MCLNPISKVYHYAGKSVIRTFACGKCVECLKQKQNDYAVGALRTAKHYGYKVEFVTLTYRPASVPVMRTDYKINDDGEMEVISQDFVNDRKKLCKSDFDKRSGFLVASRQVYDSDPRHPISQSNIGQVVSIMPRRFDSKISKKCAEFSFCGNNIYSEYCHSLCRKDLRLSLKRGRVSYFRQYGCNLPEFKYLAVGEYGKKGRPHYHLLVFGLDHQDCVSLFEDWRKRYGYVMIKTVVPKDKNESFQTAVEKTCRYVSKYITKGCFDDSKVISKVAEKPRKMASLDFGFWTPTEKEQSWYLGYDIVGNAYNNDRPETFWKYLPKLLNRLPERMSVYYSDTGSPYKFPKPLKQKLLYAYKITNVSDKFDEVEYGKVVFRSSALSHLLQTFIQNNSYQDFMQRIRQMERACPDKEPLQIVRDVQSGQKISRLKRAKDYAKNLLEMYNTSDFD